MKKNLQNLCLLLAIIGISGLSLGLALLSNVPGTRLSNRVRPVQAEESVSAAGVEAVKVESVSTDVVWRTSSNGQLTARLTGEASGEAPRLEVNRTGNQVLVALRYPRHSVISFGHTINRLTLEVYVPATRISSVEVGTISGDVRLDSLTAGDFRFHSVSGSLDSAKLTTDGASLSSTSGDVRVEGLSNQAKVSTVSGDIELGYTPAGEGLNVKSTSGEVRLDLPAEAQFTLEAHSTSGQIGSAFPVTVVGSARERRQLNGVVGGGGPRVVVETVSGDVDLY